MPGRASLLLLLAWAACAHLPALSPVHDVDTVVRRCRQAYPRQPWHATHALFATFPLSYHSGLVGVTAAGPQGLSAILLSPEGLTLFDAIQDNRNPLAPDLRVERAVPPFDRQRFAASLMADVGTTFLPPQGPPTAVGRYANGETVCRWRPAVGETTDVQLADGIPRIIRSFARMHLVREIFLLGNPDDGFYPQVTLAVPGAGGYRLDMQLVGRE